MNDVIKVIKSRRSVRKYTQEQISQENLNLILEAGIYAPTAHNEQPWHFTVIQNPDLLKHINDTVRINMANSDGDWTRKMGSNSNFQVTYDAPTLIIVSGKIDGILPHEDCAAAIQNMLIAAKSLNIGSVWLGLMWFYFDDEAVSKLQIPEGYEPYFGVSFGYSGNEVELPAPKRN